jgi:hypothetical protein
VQIPLSGNPTLKCKNPDCKASVDLGFVFDLTEWAEKFQLQKFTCPSCNLTAAYSSSDLLLIPAKNPEKE